MNGEKNINKVEQINDNNKKNQFKKLIIPILILLNVINILILIIPVMPEKEEKLSDKLVNIKDLGKVITTNGNYYLSLENKSLIKNNSFLTWKSSDSKVIDVSSCNHKNECNLVPSTVGNVAITVYYTDEGNKISDSDTIYISVIESEVINFYLYDNKIYVDKLSQKKYADLDKYEKKASYTCKGIDCQFVYGNYNAIIKDNNRYINVNIMGLKTDDLNRNYGCDKILCNAKYEEDFDFSQIKSLVDYYSGISAFLIGNDKGYTGVYSLEKFSLKEIEFKNYIKVDNIGYDLMLYDFEKDYLYNLKTNEIKTIDFPGVNIGKINSISGMTYYYLSRNQSEYNRNCIILDSNYNFLFNSKVFDYAVIGGYNLYTYETNGDSKIAHVYNLDGNEIKNYFDDDFEIYGYFYDEFAIGRKNNKILLIKLSDKSIIDEFEELDNYTSGILMDKTAAAAFLSSNDLAPLAQNEFILQLYTNDKNNKYIKYSVIRGNDNTPKIETQILSVKDVNSNED